MKVSSLAGIRCECLKKYLKMSNTLGEYLNTNTLNS